MLPNALGPCAARHGRVARLSTGTRVPVRPRGDAVSPACHLPSPPPREARKRLDLSMTGRARWLVCAVALLATLARPATMGATSCVMSGTPPANPYALA